MYICFDSIYSERSCMINHINIDIWCCYTTLLGQKDYVGIHQLNLFNVTKTYHYFSFVFLMVVLDQLLLQVLL